MAIFMILPTALLAADSVESATVITKLKDGPTETRLVQAQRIDDNTSRIIVTAHSIPEDFEYLDIVADNAVAEKGEDGFWIFPRGEMGTFRLDNAKYQRESNQLPIYGMQTPRGTFLAIIKGLQLENWLIVEAKNGVYKIFPRWQAHYIGFQPYEDIVIDFITLTGDDANYSGMGRAYRKHQLTTGIVTPFKQRMKNNEALQQIGTAMPHFYAHGVIRGARIPKNFTPETLPPVTPLIKFADGKKFVDAFKEAGMTDVHFCAAGWQNGGYGGKSPQVFPVEKSLGTEEELKDYIRYAQSLGYAICNYAMHTDAFTGSEMWDEDYVAKALDGSMPEVGPLNGGWMYYICQKRSWDLFIRKQIEQTRRLGFRGSYFIDVYSARPPDPCFDRRHPANRKEQAEYQNKALSYAKRLFGSASSECGFEHCIQNIDYVNYLGRHMLVRETDVRRRADGTRMIFDKDKMIDRIAPLWELVYHGIVLSNPDKFTQGYLPKGSDGRLRLVEFGGRPMQYRSDYSPRMIKRYREMYDLFQPLKHLQLEFMEENRELAKDVYLTRFGDGGEIITNYSKRPFTYKGKTVLAHDYKLWP